MVTQLSEDGRLEAVFKELLGAEGSEIYLRPAEWYVQPGEDVTWATVVAGASRRNETAIGLKSALLAEPGPEVRRGRQPAEVADLHDLGRRRGRGARGGLSQSVGDLWLVRHGETEWSRDGRHTSTTDLPLLPEGEDGARALAPRLAGEVFALVLTSPRLAGAATRRELAGFPDAEVDDDLAEWDYGDLRGRDHRRDPRERSRAGRCGRTRAPAARPPSRSASGSTGWWPAQRRRPATRCCSATGTRSRALAARWLGLPVTEGRLLRLDTGTVSVLGHEREHPVVLRWNS